jgi:hypothetical protein
MTTSAYITAINQLLNDKVIQTYNKCRYGSVEYQRYYIIVILIVVLYDIIDENINDSMEFTGQLTNEELRSIMGHLSDILNVNYLPDTL